MDIEFHYYITYILAREAGFNNDDSYIIAYSSQYVDDNCTYYYVNFEDGSDYTNEVSQTMDITKPSAKRQKIYPLFHFFPGDPDSPTARRKDGKKHPFTTTPNSANAKEIFQKALATKDLYRIGIATHVYADTWAHQNFIGMEDKFNALAGWEILPNIGHADARHEPDKVDNRWKDTRLVDDIELIDNNDRFLEAAENIFSAYCRYNDPVNADAVISTKWTDLKKRLKEAMHESYLFGSDDRARIKAYNDICKGIPEYDEKEWRHDAVEKLEIEPDLFDRYWARNNFYISHWGQFQKAAEAHYDLSREMLKPIYKEAGLPI